MIEAVALTKRYGRTAAVDQLSFTVRPGRVTGFLGPNGSGKSTTMRMILGLDRPTSGHIRIDGRRYRDLRRPSRTVGALLDAKWVHPNRSARAHLRWQARIADLPDRRVDQVLDQVGLGSVAGQRAGEFSLGMSQRLGIAAALLGDPSVLLLDEPVNGLDPQGILWIRDFMHGLAAEGRTVFVSSHLLSEMALTAQDLVVIGGGRLIAQCTVAEFIDSTAAPVVRVRSPQADRLAQRLRERQLTVVEAGPDKLTVTGADAAFVGEAAAEAGLALHELTVERASLEQAFFEMTEQHVEFRAATSDLAAVGR